jgi:hypothetical protein
LGIPAVVGWNITVDISDDKISESTVLIQTIVEEALEVFISNPIILGAVFLWISIGDRHIEGIGQLGKGKLARSQNVFKSADNLVPTLISQALDLGIESLQILLGGNAPCITEKKQH